jgi:hypothetical protein
MKREWRQQELAHEKCFLRRIKLRFGLEKEIMIEVMPDRNISLKVEIIRSEIKSMHTVNHPHVIQMKNILQFFN